MLAASHTRIKRITRFSFLFWDESGLTLVGYVGMVDLLEMVNDWSLEGAFGSFFFEG
jgi:hypothetical protein